MSGPKLVPSSGTDGFFQEAPKLVSQYEEDEAWRRCFQFYIPLAVQDAISPDLSRFADLVRSNHVISLCSNAESYPPSLEGHDSWGRHTSSPLKTSHGWKELKKIQQREGLIAIAYEKEFGRYSRVYQFFKCHLWGASSAGVNCPAAMTDGAAKVLHTILRGHVNEQKRETLYKSYCALISRDPERAWTSGQWMTERPGGSDVRNTETIAEHVQSSTEEDTMMDAHGNKLGDWQVGGFKWFSSATDADMAVLLAKTSKGGLSAFYAPLRRRQSSATSKTPTDANTESNGITIQRLKQKLGTRALPTAELVLTNTRAHLLGLEGQGVKVISTILNITRIHNAVSSVGGLGRGLAISRAFARVRKVQGGLLLDIPAHMATMAKMHVEYRAMMLFTYFGVALLGVTENVGSRYDEEGSGEKGTITSHTVPEDVQIAETLLRVLTPVVKAVTAKSAIAGLQECMESLGGVGYLDSTAEAEIPFNIARLLRDANVLSIWEGTTDVMASDLVRVMKSSGGEDMRRVLAEWLEMTFQTWTDKQSKGHVEVIGKRWEAFTERVAIRNADELLHGGRKLMAHLGWIVCAVLLVEDARRDRNEVAWEIASRWLNVNDTKLVEGGKAEIAPRHWTEVAAWDRRIVFGDEHSDGRARL